MPTTSAPAQTSACKPTTSKLHADSRSGQQTHSTLYSVIGIDDDSEQQHACATNSAHEAAAEEQDSLLAQLQAATARIHALQCQLSDVQEVQKQQQLKEAALAAQLAHAQQHYSNSSTQPRQPRRSLNLPWLLHRCWQTPTSSSSSWLLPMRVLRS